MKVLELAVDVARQYLRRDAQPEQSHGDNVQRHLRIPVQALTAYLLSVPYGDATGQGGGGGEGVDKNCDETDAAIAPDDRAGGSPAAGGDETCATSLTGPASVAVEEQGPAESQAPSLPSDQGHHEGSPENDEKNTSVTYDSGIAGPCNAIPLRVEEWRAYVSQLSTGASKEQTSVSVGCDDARYDRLDRRTKARLEAFLEGVILAVSQEPLVTKAGSEAAGADAGKTSRTEAPPAGSSASTSASAGASTAKSRRHKAHAGAVNGLVGSVEGATKMAFSALKRGSGSLSNTSAGGAPSPARALSTGSSSSQKSQSSTGDAKGRRYPQIRERALVTRLELYIRSLWRVRQSNGRSEPFVPIEKSPNPFDPIQQHAPLGAALAAPEPARSMRIRAQLLVDAFVDTIDNVHQQSTVLSRLLKAATRELLAVDHLSESILKLVHRLISNYVQSVSFASLAFLSSPETSANQHLLPKVVQYLKHLQTNWRDCVAECELERMLALSIDGDLRNTLKNIEFRSIGHLLEVCQGFRAELTKISLAPDMRAPGFDLSLSAKGGEQSPGARNDDDNRDAIRQALRDLQREVITVNGSLLPPVTSRRELISLLSQTLNSRTLASAMEKNAALASSSAGKSRRRRQQQQQQQRAARSSANPMDGKSGDEATTSDYDTDLSGYNVEKDANANATARKPGAALQRRRSFRLSTIDFLTRRLLLAASRTGTFGDAYFVVRDLFGGEDVEVVPSQSVYRLGRSVRPGSIEINVKLASLTIKCHGSFDVYPRSMVGDCEPLIQLHTTTTETIGLQEVRACDTASHNGSKNDEYDSDECNGERGSFMVVQERLTEKTGWRYLSIRPALYEKYEEFSTPS
jgi:hypothetical protein